jgi:hypothetical protein
MLAELVSLEWFLALRAAEVLRVPALIERGDVRPLDHLIARAALGVERRIVVALAEELVVLLQVRSAAELGAASEAFEVLRMERLVLRHDERTLDALVTEGAHLLIRVGRGGGGGG